MRVSCDHQRAVHRIGFALRERCISPYLGYKLVVRFGLDRMRAFAPAGDARTLLLLRVFGYKRRTEQLLHDLALAWRPLGPVRLIAGADLAETNLEPHEFFDFLNGRLSRQFVSGEADLETRLSATRCRTDPDGLHRIEDFFCLEQTLRMTVERLAQGADAVLMDLRGFGPENQGCVFEIEHLMRAVPIGRIVLLVDASTDRPFLEATARRGWHMRGAHPDPAGAEGRTLQLLHIPRASGEALRRLLNALDRAAGAAQ